MKFIVDRTSLYGNEDKPCEGAFRGKVLFVDERTVDNTSKIPTYRGESEWWYRKGMNHRVENGCIKRDFEKEVWFIEIDSLEDLMRFVEKHGRIVIDYWTFYENFFVDYKLKTPYFRIEIYDAWRE